MAAVQASVLSVSFLVVAALSLASELTFCVQCY
jgi:hypothetical protein